MKRIGIITVQKAPNYGAMLQCFALQKFILKLGHICEVIDLCRPYHKEFVETKGYKPYRMTSRIWEFRMAYRKFRREYLYFLREDDRRYHEFLQRHKEELSAWNKGFEKFNKRIIYSKKYLSIGDLYKNPPKYDLYITGSDQLWNPTQKYCIEPYFLTFVQNGAPKISYATSIGQDELPANVMADYCKWLKDYNMISLREQSAINMLQPRCENKIERTIDPTLLIPSTEWEEIAENPKESDYVFCFYLSNNKELLNYAEKYAEIHNKKLIYWAHDWRDETVAYHNHKAIIDITPEQWIGYIKNADEIFTDSFHGTVFSIIFKRKFKTLIPQVSKRGSRILDLFDMLNIKSCLLVNLDNHSSVDLPDYENAHKIIKSEREKSISFISKALTLTENTSTSTNQESHK